MTKGSPPRPPSVPASSPPFSHEEERHDDSPACIHYVQSNGGSNECETLQTVRALSMALSVSADWQETSHKRMLWAMYTALFVKDISHVSILVEKMDLLGTDLRLMKERDVGLAIFTERDMQVNVHIMVPLRERLYDKLYGLVLISIGKLFPCHTINSTPLSAHVAGMNASLQLLVRRFVPSSFCIPSLSLCLETMRVHLLGKSVPVHEVITDMRSISPSCFPLTRLDDKEKEHDLREGSGPVLYWHRFPCGRIVSFLNTDVEVNTPIPYPSVPSEVTIRPEDTLCGDIYAYTAMLRGERDYLIHTIGVPWIPIQFREVVAHIVCSSFGVTDSILQECYKIFHNVCFSVLLKEMLLMKDMIDLCASNSIDFVGERIASILLSFSNTMVWEKWVLTSPLVHHILSHVRPDTMSLMTKRYPFLLCTLGVLLFDRIGTWSARDMQNAMLMERMTDSLRSRSNKGVLYRMKRVVYERKTQMERMEHDAEKMGKVFLEEEERREMRERTASTDKKEKKKMRKRKTKGEKEKKGIIVVDSSPPEKKEDGGDGDVGVEEETGKRKRKTMHRLVEEISSLLSPHEVELIGSGIFIDSSDADIVVTVKDVDDISSCYEIVRERTGWTPLFKSVTGDRVVILRGEFHGVQVDAQVWRGEDALVLSKAEEMTRSALLLSRTLDTNVDEEGRECIRDLHGWFTCSRMKGHSLCRLPGVGVTCASVSFRSCRGSVSLREQLRHFSDCLERQTPSLDFDSLTSLTHDGSDSSSEGERERCLLPLHVCVTGTNCAFRMTTMTTRHLLDSLSFSLSLKDEDLLRVEVYRAWRRETMVVAARVVPLSYHFASQTLFSFCSSMDTHPLIDSLHVEEETEQTRGDETPLRVTILCTLRGEDASKYGFREGDTVLPADEENVLVQREGKRGHFFLCLSPRRGSPRSSPHPSLSSPSGKTNDMLSFSHPPTLQSPTSFPNLPTLTQDVLSKFDARAWRADVPVLV